MPISIVCPSCEKKLSVPEKAAGTRIMCTKCGEIIPVPKSLVPRKEEELPVYKKEASPGNLRQALSDFKAMLTKPQGLGICGLSLALLSIPLMCILPVAISLSSVGLAVSLLGVALAWYRRDRKALSFPLVGIVANILSLLLAFLPEIGKGEKVPGERGRCPPRGLVAKLHLPTQKKGLPGKWLLLPAPDRPTQTTEGVSSLIPTQ
jgi:hypothetical protein